MAQPGGVKIDPRFFPTFEDATAEPEKRNLITSGLLTGLGEAGSILGSAVQGVGNISGLPVFEEAGKAASQASSDFAQNQSRPDLEIAPWKEGGASVLPWLGYQALKQVPQLAAYLTAGAAVPEAAIPAVLSRVGAAVPRVLGGGGLRAGADFAARRAALEAGTGYARTAVGAELAGIPLAFGSQIQEAASQPSGLQPGDAARAAFQSPLYAALDVIEPAQLKGLLSRGLEGGLARRVATAGLAGAAAEVPQEAVQTALELSFRPDLSTKDKMSQIVDAALTGGAVGGVLGGAGGLRPMKSVDPAALSNEAISDVVDRIAGLLPSPVAVSDASGRTAIGAGADEALRAAPVEPGLSPTDELVASYRPGAQPAIESQTIIQPKQGSLRWAQEHPQEDLSRPFRDQPDEALQNGLAAAQRRIDAGTANDNILRTAQMIQDELDQRSVNDVATEAGAQGSVEAVQRDEASSGAAGTSAAPVSTTQDFPTRLAELKKGRSNQWVAKLEAADEADLLEKFHTQIFENQDTRPTTVSRAQQLGLLDEQLNPTPLAAEIETRKQEAAQTASVTTEQAAPASQRGGGPFVDREFQAEWKSLTKGMPGDAIKALKANPPKSMAEAQRRVYESLGGVGPQDEWQPGKKGHASIENLAIKLGVLDENTKQLTDVGMEIAKQDPISTATAVKAAMAQGFKGAQASMFDRGVREYLGGEKITKFSTFDEMGAYQAGKAWAEEHNAVPRVASNYWSEREMETEFRGGNQNPEQIGKVVVPPDQQQKRWLNLAIEERYVGNPEIAQLKQMAQEGATPDDVEEMARYFASGRGPLLRPNLAPPQAPFKGEVVTRGAPRRGTIEQTPIAVPKAERTAVDQAAIERFKERQAFREHLQDLVNEVEEEQAASQEVADRELKVDKAGRIKASPAVTSRASPLIGHLLPTSLYDNRVSLRTALRVLHEQAQTKFDRVLANRIQTTMSMLSRAGWQFSVRIAHPGEEVPAELAWARGLTITNDDGTVEVWLNGLDGRGTDYGVFAHEMSHAVTTAAIEAGRRAEPGTPLAEATKDLVDVYERVKNHLDHLNPASMSAFQYEAFTKRNNALDDVHELVAWTLTDPHMQEYLATIPYNSRQSLWSRLVEAIRTLFGLDFKDDNALAEVLRVSERLMDNAPSVKELQELLGDSGFSGETAVLGQRRTPMRTSALTQEIVKQATAKADEFAQRTDVSGKAIDAQLYIADRHHIIEHFKRWFDNRQGANPLTDLETHEKQRTSIVAKMTQMITNSIDAFNALKRVDKGTTDKMQQLMTATEFPFDPTKPWREQLAAVQKMSRLKVVHQQYHDIWRGLNAEGRKIYSDLRSVNDVQFMAYHATLLHAQIVADTQAAEALGATIYNTPMDRFLGELKDFNPVQARAWWAKTINDMQTNLKNFLAAEEHGKDPGTVKAMKEQYKPLRERAGETALAVRRIEEKPYFHLPRFGEYFVDWKVADQEALAKVADVLEGRGFGGVISKDSDQNHVFIRLENVAQQTELANIIEGLKRGSNPLVTESRVGKLSDERYSSRLIDRSLQRVIEGIQANPDFDDDAKQSALASLRKTALDMMPENSIARVMTERKGVPGYSKDMIRGYAQRAKIGADSMADMVLAPKIAQAFTSMRSAVSHAQKAPLSEVPVEQRNGMQKVVDELSRRIRERAEWSHNPLLDALSKITSAHYLGLSPAFAFVQFTQLGATTLPQLGAEYGFANAFGKMASATPLALRIIRQIFAGGKEVSLSRAMDAVITRKALDVPGVSPRMADFLMHLVNTGRLDIGGQIRELVRAAEGQEDVKLDQVLRYASSMGYYAETLTRLVSAIATYQLNPSASIEEASAKASRVIDESLFDFSPDNWGRLFGRKGFLGAATPLATKFMQYNAQLVGKLYREAYTAFADKAASAEEKRLARRFLAGHLASMTVMAGTLGLPMVTVFAAAFDALKDAFDDDDDPSDVRSAYRQYLSEIFGNELEPLLSKGALRAAGIDLTTRIGEQDIIPFSRFIGDKRSIKDSLSDLQSRAWGAPTSMVTSYAKGIDRISEGDALGGMIAALPIGLANPLKAFRMEARDRFVDANGKELPVDPSTMDIIAQAIGFNPGQNADYSERRGAEKSQQGQLSRRATTLRDQMVDAMVDGDEDRMRQLAPDIIKFDRAHPDRPSVLMSIRGSYKRRVKEQYVSTMTGQPLGVKPGTGDYTFGDIEFRAQ